MANLDITVLLDLSENFMIGITCEAGFTHTSRTHNVTSGILGVHEVLLFSSYVVALSLDMVF